MRYLANYEVIIIRKIQVSLRIEGGVIRICNFCGHCWTSITRITAYTISSRYGIHDSTSGNAPYQIVPVVSKENIPIWSHYQTPGLLINAAVAGPPSPPRPQVPAHGVEGAPTREVIMLVETVTLRIAQLLVSAM